MKKTSYKIRFNPAITVDDINATLGSDEIARNYAIDKARFGLP